MVISLITSALLAGAAILVPTLAEAADAGPPPGLHRAEAVAPGAEPAASGGAGTAPRPPGGPPGYRPAADRGPWRPPVDGLDLLTAFDPPPLPWMPGHRGVDLGAADSQEVVAAGAGTVVFAGDLAGRGVVSVAHADGLRTTYEPVEPLVAAGEAVAAGQAVGRLQPGHASCPAAACLHLGLKRGPLYLDPMLLFGAGKVRLLPRPGRAVQAAEHSGDSATAAAEDRRTAAAAHPAVPTGARP